MIIDNCTNDCVSRLRSTLAAMRIGREKNHASWMASFLLYAHVLIAR